MKTFIALVIFCAASVTFAAKEHDHAPVKVSPEFENMKALVGTWEGKTKMDGKDQDLKVIYELTSGGTAIVEKMNPGTPMEMVTVYANNGKNVYATHYCALGNQPQMTLKHSKDHLFAFEMVGTKGVSNKKEMHMHSVTLTLDGNKLKQEWTNYKDGKKGDVATFELTKKM